MLDEIASQNKKLFIVSNSDMLSREELAQRINNELDHYVPAERIYTSAYIAGGYIRQKYPDVNRLRLVGNDSIKRELEQEFDFEVVGASDLEQFCDKPISIDTFNKIPLDPKVKAVLVASDKSFSCTKLCLASLYVSAGKAKLICTNTDKNFKLNGRVFPGTGSIVQSLKICLNNQHGSQLMTEPEVAGMPNPYVFELIRR